MCKINCSIAYSYNSIHNLNLIDKSSVCDEWTLYWTQKMLYFWKNFQEDSCLKTKLSIRLTWALWLGVFIFKLNVFVIEKEIESANLALQYVVPEGSDPSDHLRPYFHAHFLEVSPVLDILLEEAVGAGRGRAPGHPPPDSHEEKVHGVGIHTIIIGNWKTRSKKSLIREVEWSNITHLVQLKDFLALHSLEY